MSTNHRVLVRVGDTESEVELEAPADLGPTLAAVVRAASTMSWSAARGLCRRGAVTIDGLVVRDDAARVRRGGTVKLDPRAPPRAAATAKLPEGVLIHVDRDIVVVDKPPGIATVPTDPGDRESLVQRLRVELGRKEGRPSPPLRVVQRLDKGTSGVLVFARSKRAERGLGAQFRRRAHANTRAPLGATLEPSGLRRRYLALCIGRVAPARFTCDTWLVANRGDGLRGSCAAGSSIEGARRAITEVDVLEVRTLEPSAWVGPSPACISLVACRLQTGRQHQIRIHLAERGHPLAGERVYVRDYGGGRPAPAPARPLLHAEELGFVHPATAELVVFGRAPPQDFEAWLQRGRKPPGERPEG